MKYFFLFIFLFSLNSFSSEKKVKCKKNDLQKGSLNLMFGGFPMSKFMDGMLKTTNLDKLDQKDKSKKKIINSMTGNCIEE